MQYTENIKVIIGLGNPGPRFARTRHNIGFMVLDQLALEFNGIWHTKDIMQIADVRINNHLVVLIKPQTFMNNSGQVVAHIKKKGVQAEQLLVVHDELEKPFGSTSLKQGGSARGHNGLKSLISYIGPDFYRLRCGIGRPENKADVPNYVLAIFNEDQAQVQHMIQDAVEKIVLLFD